MEQELSYSFGISAIIIVLLVCILLFVAFFWTTKVLHANVGIQKLTKSDKFTAKTATGAAQGKKIAEHVVTAKSAKESADKVGSGGIIVAGAGEEKKTVYDDDESEENIIQKIATLLNTNDSENQGDSANTTNIEALVNAIC